jgi:glutamine synthetase
LQIPPPIRFGEYFLIKNTTQKAQFKRAILAQQKQYMDLFAALTIQGNAYDERIQLIHRTVQEMQAAGIPISKTELHTARERLEQYEQGKIQVLRQRKFVLDHLEQSKLFMQKVDKSRARRRY